MFEWCTMPSGNPPVQPPTSTDNNFDSAAETTSAEESSHPNTTEVSHGTSSYPVRQRRPPSYHKDYVSSQDIP